MNGVLNQYIFVDYNEQNENFSNIVHYNERIYAVSHSKRVIHFRKTFNYTIKKGVIQWVSPFFQASVFKSCQNDATLDKTLLAVISIENGIAHLK